ncbi:F-box protein At1g60400-like [Carex rostrata]
MMNTKRCCGDKNYDIDKISSLPDDVLTHILSFLSTRKAMQTCILSKRWKNTWASVPILEFNIKEFGLPKIIDDEMAVESVIKFGLLVKSALEKRERSCVIKRFQLWLDSGVHWPRTYCGRTYWPRTQAVADCICDGMKLKPQECSVKLDSCAKLNLNTNLIFTCASLIDLQLQFYIEDNPFVVIKPNSVNLPCLKTLDLTGDIIMSDDFYKKLLLGCPVLEELVLSCYGGIIEICSNTLKKLVIEGCDEGSSRLQISTPNLIYFEICIMYFKEILLQKMPSLVNALISVPGWFDQDQYITGVPKFIANFSNLERLKLQFYFPDEKVLWK